MADGGSNVQDGGFPPDGGHADAGSQIVYWCNGVDQVLFEHCAPCHGESRSGSGDLPFRLDVYADIDGGAEAGGLNGAKSQAVRIKVRAANFKNMPPATNGPEPTADERKMINDWVLTGAQECGESP